MKKIAVFLLGLFLLTGCTSLMNTPTDKVEEYLDKYKTTDQDILDQLEDVVDEVGTMNDDNKTKYKELMKKQYQNLSYKIKDETIDGDKATVEAEIEVYDYKTSIDKSDRYLSEHNDEFLGEDNNLDNDKFMTYKLEALDKVTDKVTYTINFSLTKDADGNWKLDDISDTDRLKLHGLYS